MIQPPLLPGHATQHYNSLVDLVDNPSIFVVQVGLTAL